MGDNEYPLTELIQLSLIDFYPHVSIIRKILLFRTFRHALADEILGFLLAALMIGRLGMTSLASEKEFSMRRLGWLDRSRREQG